MRYFYFIIAIFFYFSFSSSNAAVISNVVLENNERISKETVITYGNIKLNKDYNQNEINQILYNLYNTNFFQDVKIQIKDDSLIGIGAIILNKAVIGKNCIIGANSLIAENKEIPDGSLVIGSPGKIIRQLKDEEIKAVKKNAEHYVQNWKNFEKNFK